MNNSSSTTTGSNYKSIRVNTGPPVAQPKIPVNKMSMNDPVQPKLRIVTDPTKMPLGTRLSDNVQGRDFSQPPHGYRGAVNSKSEAKGVPSSSSGAPPMYVASTFTHIVNAPTRPSLPKPLDVSLPRPRPVLTADSMSHAPPLNNRTMTGKILGTAAKNVINEINVPYLPPDQPVGPDNPVKVLNATWTACWDKEAGAIYYYNQKTGEATWIPPDNL